MTLVPELATDAVSQSAWGQLQRLARNIEDDILGNHVIRNARALVLGGMAFDASELTRHGIDLLRRELPQQVLADGGHYERSPSYHLVVLRDLLEVAAATPHVWLGETIERMRTFAAGLQRPDGAPALFNDGTADAPRLDLPPSPDGMTVFEASGFIVVRDGPLWLAFRCGRPSPQFLPAHAHADALSFQLWWRGRPVATDAGSSTYEPGAARAWERGTAAHSTVRIDGRDQFRVWGAFRSGPLPNVKLRYARAGAIEASVDWPGRMRHVRRLEWDPEEGVILVQDRVEGRGRHLVESRVLWAAGRAPADIDLLSVAAERDEPASAAERPGEAVPTSSTVFFTDSELPVSIEYRLRCLE